MAMTREYFSDFTIKWATLNWEIEAARMLRRQVFCQEQQVFEGSDADAIDPQAQLIVACANHGGWHEQIVGTVRIHQEAAGVWWGSRLALANEFRGQRQLAAGLIRLAVSSARGLGCREFFATVQPQNERLFRRLHWCSQGKVEVAGRPHVLMQAELDHYPPCHTPRSGFVLANGLSQHDEELILPMLLHPYRQHKLIGPIPSHGN